MSASVASVTINPEREKLLIVTTSYFHALLSRLATKSNTYTLSLHDALPICPGRARPRPTSAGRPTPRSAARLDRKSTRLNSSHVAISYAVFCLKKKKSMLNLPPSYPSKQHPTHVQPSHITELYINWSLYGRS